MVKSASSLMWALIAANFAAAAATGALVFLLVVVVFAASPGDAGVVVVLGGVILLGVLRAFAGFLISFPVYLVGLIVVGIPTWWCLDRAGWANAGAFVGVAALESVIAGMLVLPEISPDATIFALALAIPGGLAGWTIWRNGYSRIKPPPARPS
ncbi:hypothetical protein [Brevundimonas sp.]|uniref:hypothetical protein n=1 Tax=Brevundimonas sp. TaxID=1871086 RepID=UPI003D14CE29